MRQVKRNFQTESIIRIILVLAGLISFALSSRFAWGFLLGGLISKENIDLKTKEGWFLLALLMGIIVLAFSILLDWMATIGYIVSTVSYFLLRMLINNYQNKIE